MGPMLWLVDPPCLQVKAEFVSICISSGNQSLVPAFSQELAQSCGNTGLQHWQSAGTEFISIHTLVCLNWGQILLIMQNYCLGNLLFLWYQRCFRLNVVKSRERNGSMILQKEPWSWPHVLLHLLWQITVTLQVRHNDLLTPPCITV